MFKNMKLATKISLGFGILIAIAGMLGYVGWMGLTNVTKNAEILAKSNQCLDQLNGCAQIRRDFAINGFAKDEKTGKTAADKWFDTFDKLTTEISSLASTPGLSPANKDLANNALNKSKPYKEAFDGQIEAQKLKDEAFAEWGKTGDAITTDFRETMKSLIAPAIAKASESKDVNALTRWAKIDNMANESILANFLQLRTQAVYLASTNTKKQWLAYNEQLNVCQEESSKFTEYVKGDTTLEIFAAKIDKCIKGYETIGEKYYKGMLASETSDKDMAQSATQIVELVNTLLSNIQKNVE
ncbi:MAG: hypothetical protein ABFD79_01815, partial [Phycisphaerales bacterium]